MKDLNILLPKFRALHDNFICRDGRIVLLSNSVILRHQLDKVYKLIQSYRLTYYIAGGEIIIHA